MTEGTATITAAIKKANTSIDTLLDGYTPQEPEEARKIQATTPRANYQTLLDKLEEFIDTCHRASMIPNSMDDILTPEQINKFLLITTILEKDPYYSEYTGFFISLLLKNSYNAGHNNFTLNMDNLPALNYIGVFIKVTEEPLVITITGKTGDDCGWNANNCTFNVEKTGERYGRQAKNCTFNTEETGEFCGYGALNCTFKTTNPKTLQQMLEQVPKGNRVVFIDAGGKEKVMRDYK